MDNDKFVSKEILVSVIIPCYNAEKYIERCIESVISQDYENIEIVVVDDGSTDKSIELLEKYIDIKVYSQKNMGACAARNLGIKKCAGYYVKFLDADDFLSPNAISKQIIFSRNIDENYIPYGYRKVLLEGCEFEKKSKLDTVNQFESLINQNITITLPLHRRSTLIDIGLFDEGLQFRQEWDLHLRLAHEKYIFIYQDVCVFTQVVFDSPSRISSRKLNVVDEVKNINRVRSKFIKNNKQKFSIAWAHKYWTLGRQFLKSGRNEDANYVFAIAKEISPKNYLDLNPKLYKLAVHFVGAVRSEKIIKLYKKFRSNI